MLRTLLVSLLLLSGCATLAPKLIPAAPTGQHIASHPLWQCNASIETYGVGDDVRELWLVFDGVPVGYAAFEPGVEGRLKYLMIRPSGETERQATKEEMDIPLCDLIKYLGSSPKI